MKNNLDIVIDAKYKSHIFNSESASQELKEEHRRDIHQLLAYTTFTKNKNKIGILCYPYTVLHQLDQKIIYPHYDFKHLTEKYFEIGMKLDDFLIQLVKYCYSKEYIFKLDYVFQFSNTKE